MRGLKILFSLVIALVALTYIVPMGAKSVFSGDGIYDVTFDDLPLLALYELKLPSIIIDQEKKISFSFKRFFTANTSTHLTLCVTSPRAIPFWEVTTNVHLRLIENQSNTVVEICTPSAPMELIRVIA